MDVCNSRGYSPLAAIRSKNIHADYFMSCDYLLTNRIDSLLCEV